MRERLLNHVFFTRKLRCLLALVTMLILPLDLLAQGGQQLNDPDLKYVDPTKQSAAPIVVSEWEINWSERFNNVSYPYLYNPHQLQDITYTSSDESVATIDGNGTITPVAPGTTTITASYPEDGWYNSGTASYELTYEDDRFDFSQSGASLSSTTASATYGDTSVSTPDLMKGDLSKETFTYDSSNKSVATVDASGVVTIVAAGSTDIIASFGGNEYYKPGSLTYALTVNKKTVTVTAGITASDKTYDGSTSATLVCSSATISGRVGNDVLTVTATGTFADANVGAGKTVAISGITLGGTAVSNYVLAASGNQSSTTANITAKEATLSWSNTSFTYDGQSHVPTATVSNLIGSDACTVTVDGAQTNVGTYTATATALSNSNYKLPTTVTQSFTISAATMTVTATGYDAAYDGQAHGISVSAPDGATVKYGESATSCTLDASPTYTNVGTYTVYYEVTKANYTTITGSATVKISKAAGSISYATASVDKTFGDAAFTNALTKTGDGGVTYSSGNTAVATVDATSGQVTIVGAGSATITATVTDGTNYTYATKTASYTLTVAAATMTVTATGYSAAYDGQAHGISVTAPEGATVKYGESATNCTLDASPTYTNAGTYTVYYEVTKANYGTVTGSATVTISKAAGSISYATASVSKTFGDAAFTNALTKTGDGTVTYSSSNTGVATVNSSTGEVAIKGDGTTTITATVADGTNYTYATKTATYTLSVGVAAMEVSATGYEGVYDGQPHSIRVTAPEGAKVRYGEGAAIYTSDTSPTFTNAGDYLVFYEVTKENYATVTGSAAVKISKVPVTLFMDVSDKTIKKDEKIRIEYSTSPVGLPIVFSSSDDAVTMISTIKVDSRFSELFVKALYPGEATITATYDGGTNYESISASFTVTVEVEAIQAINDNQNYSFEASDYMNADGSEEPLNGVIINNIFHNLSVGNSTGYDSEEKCLAIGSPTSPENIRGAVEGTARFLMDNDYPSDPAEYDEWLALWSGMAFFVDAPGEGEEGVLTVESKEEGACHIAIQPGVSDLSTFQHSERDKDDVLITPDGVFDLKKWLEDNGYVWIGSADGKDAMPVVIVNVLDGSARTKAIQKGKKSGINVKVYTVTYKVRSTSGIETIDRETKILSEDGWYDLRGQRISQPQKKGLYINNGRKIVIK